ncbi:MAG TPA: O-antigen ligase family protein [Polyangiaceae bacterium]
MQDRPVGADVKGAFALAVVLALLAVAFDDGSIAWILAVPIILLLLYAMVKAPLRHSLMGFMLCAFILENPNEMPAGGMWKSPLFSLGAMMLTHMNNHAGQSWLFFSGLDVLLGFLIIIAWHRHSTGSRIDGVDRVPAPKILKTLALLSLGGVLYCWIWGVLRGGDTKVIFWQAEKIFYLPIFYLLFAQALRGTKDYVALGRVVLIAACVRSLLAAYVMNWADIKGGDVPAHATSHHDSILFACAAIILVSMLIHRGARPNSVRVALVVVPILVWGMISNNRRMVWVQIALVLLTLYFVMPPTLVKRKIKKIGLALSPLALIYTVVGWRSNASMFKPVATLRSVVEPATDMSTMTRDIENYCITQTIRQSPIMGSGYGHGYLELIPLPPMPHPLERYLPHNSLLGLWMSAGAVGYVMITLLWAAGVYFGVRAYRMATKPLDRAIAMVSFGAVLIYLIQCYGDVGLGAWAGVYTVAPALAVAGKLAVSTGAMAKPSPKEPQKVEPQVERNAQRPGGAERASA